MLVVDASVIAPAVADGGPDGEAFRARLRGRTIAGPDLLRIEVMSVIRRSAIGGRLSSIQATAAINDLFDLPITVYPTGPLLRQGWELRGNVTSYDACYVALAEALDCPLLTADARLAVAPTISCSTEVLRA